MTYSNAHIHRQAARLLASAGVAHEPVDLRHVVSALNLELVAHASAPFSSEAALEPQGDGHAIVLGGGGSERRRRFTIAHEIGHHVQNLTGIEAKVRQQQQSHPDRVNQLSVRLELQADCFAGVWGNSAKKEGILDPGDLESGLNAASAIGDDRLQKMARGRVSPDSFTHGSSRQRVEWFRKGFDAGNPSACDTFRAPRL